MTKRNTKSKKGFTIIEVVLVLAIAGLIFLMVFIALPALQRSQRNTQRRDDYSMLSTTITNFMSNNGGQISKLKGISKDTLKKWVNDSGKDPNGNDYNVTVYEKYSDDINAPDDTEVFIVIGANCNGTNEETGNSKPAADTSKKAFAIYGYMEGDTLYCQASGSVGSAKATNSQTEGE